MARIKRSFYLGRFQPFHAGHRSFVEYLLEDPDREVTIAVRDVRDRDADNPREPRLIADALAAGYAGEPRVKVILVPDLDEVVYGRDVGYSVRRVYLPAEIEEIRARDYRQEGGS